MQRPLYLFVYKLTCEEVVDQSKRGSMVTADEGWRMQIRLDDRCGGDNLDAVCLEL